MNKAASKYLQGIKNSDVDRDLFAKKRPEWIILTDTLLKACRTAKGGLTNATINALGLKKPLIAGWPKRLIGTRITREDYERALSGNVIYRVKLQR